MTASTIDTDRFSDVMRGRGVDRQQRKLRITNLHGSQQEQDLTEPANCAGFGRIRHFTVETPPGWPPNPLPIAPAAAALGLPDVPGALRAQVFQNAVCNWRCWYCFVDFNLLSGSDKHSDWLSAAELVALWAKEPDRPRVIDLSGGQPDLTPEWVPWMIEALERAGAGEGVYLWSDDNLSTDFFWTHLTEAERQVIYERRSYGKVCCFKGFDDRSFAFNTRADEKLFDRQFELMRRLVHDTPIDVYCYATFTTPHPDGIADGVNRFVDRLQGIDAYLPLRTVPLPVGVFTPSQGRLGDEQHRSLELQRDAIAAWQRRLEDDYHSEDLGRRIDQISLRCR